MTVAPEGFVSHGEALDQLFAVVGSPVAPARDLAGARRVYPASGSFRWEIHRGGPPERVVLPEETVWLDARWALVERLFYAHPVLLPHLREAGEAAGLRPVEAWEWSCMGLHRLLAAWRAADGLVRADLRPALLSFGLDEEHEPERLLPYEVYYPRARLDALSAWLEEVLRPRVCRGRGRWRDLVSRCVVRHRLGRRDGPEAVLERLVRESLARRAGRWVELAGRPGGLGRVRTSTFRRAAISALDGRW